MIPVLKLAAILVLKIASAVALGFVILALC